MIAVMVACPTAAPVYFKESFRSVMGCKRDGEINCEPSHDPEDHLIWSVLLTQCAGLTKPFFFSGLFLYKIIWEVPEILERSNAEGLGTEKDWRFLELGVSSHFVQLTCEELESGSFQVSSLVIFSDCFYCPSFFL